MSEAALDERRCAQCGAAYAYNPTQFAGLRPPRICRDCHHERLARLVEADGIIAQVGPVASLLRLPDGRSFFWTWSSSRTVPPMHGERFRFAYDPAEKPAPPRYPIARGVTPHE
jgi:hypothetical protein